MPCDPIRPTYRATTHAIRPAVAEANAEADDYAFSRPSSLWRHAARTQNGQNPGAKEVAARALGGLNATHPKPSYRAGKKRPKTRARHAHGGMAFSGLFARLDTHRNKTRGHHGERKGHLRRVVDFDDAVRLVHRRIRWGVMQFLLDTHVFSGARRDDPILTSSGIPLIEAAETVSVSAASHRKITSQATRGTIDAPGSSDH